MKVAIVEDNINERDAIIKHLETYRKVNGKPQYDIYCYDDGLKFLTAFDTGYDVIFLDIDLPYMNGMDIAAQIRKRNTDIIIIFVTNLQQFAIKGYSVDALDFAVKPIMYSRFCSIMRHIYRRLKPAETYIYIGSADKQRRVSVSEIYYVEIIGHRLIYHLAEDSIEVYGSIKQAEKDLPSKIFARCNNCYLVNLMHVKEIKRNIVNVGNDTLAVSQRRKSDFLSALAAYKGRG